ncbi:MAG: hypothetical protein DI587_20775 [Variovorax paradoxus]|nr:MAG: hypothetical protein DI583_20775 [Variovorax paradoxus]PZQ07195.1 MAG: hypothetical protein DI587_20775 [Variovorax paradoxus]
MRCRRPGSSRAARTWSRPCRRRPGPPGARHVLPAQPAHGPPRRGTSSFLRIPNAVIVCYVACMNTFDAPDGSWWYMSAQEKRGPVATERLQQLHAAGRIAGDTLVWRQEPSPMAAAWQPLHVVLARRLQPPLLRSGAEARPVDRQPS